MITLTEAAKKEFEEMHKGKENRPIRIFQEIGCCTSALKLTHGEPGDNDQVVQTGGFTFVMSNYVAQLAEVITIDFTAKGFIIRSKLNRGSVPEGSCSGR